ncbi:Cthe_2314 family HEPN domain-containing protein [Cohnella endophytica]|uniref:Cthe_2314 family HEPN domain-containing protein n=1 Tax=Cohnella endophytica TaxID=2419778 RepID=UPI000EAB4A97|nr:Cthe_2314 family HEPN domain-containing protein [Cohnella endophytica]
MLRELFGEEPRRWTGASLETVQAMEQFALLSAELAERSPQQAAAYRTLAIWTEGLLRSMDELEQSCYAAGEYAKRIRHTLVDEMDFKERADYHRHVYYDKNAYIRVFALLDKLGTLLNRLLGLQTERIKERFSYFTMLRNLRDNQWHAELTNPLDELKQRSQGAMSRLRIRRNLEIHQMNAELRDDLNQSIGNKYVRRTLEDLDANLADLNDSLEMVQGSLYHAFRFGCKWLRNTN